MRRLAAAVAAAGNKQQLRKDWAEGSLFGRSHAVVVVVVFAGGNDDDEREDCKEMLADVAVAVVAVANKMLQTHAGWAK